MKIDSHIVSNIWEEPMIQNLRKAKKQYFVYFLSTVFLITNTGFVLAEKIEWSETQTLKTKRIYNNSGKLVFEQNFDKSSGTTVGSVFDIRKKENATQMVKAKVLDNKYVILKDSLIKIKMLTELDSRKSKPGDSFQFETANNVVFQGKTIIPSGCKGTGTVKKVTRRGRFGRNGRVESIFNHVTLPGGKTVKLAMTKEAAEHNHHVGYAAGASMVGLAVLGPIGVAGGAFVFGNDVNIPVGSAFYLGVEEDAVVK